MIPVSSPEDMWDPNGWAERPPWQTMTLSLDGSVYCLVDEDRYDELLANGPWQLYDYGGKRYARRSRRKGERGPVAVYMHRWLAERHIPRPSPRHVIVDHVRSDGLDNRLCRLRWATPRENRLNIHGMWWQQLDLIRHLDRLDQAPENLAEIELLLHRQQRLALRSPSGE